MVQKFLIENITKRFYNGDLSLTVINSISLTCNPGEIYCILGHSGVGKSTLLNCITLLDRPTSGSVWFEGYDLVIMPDDYVTHWRKQYVGILFQLPYLINELTVIENIVLAGLIAGQQKDETYDYAYGLLDAVGLRLKAEQYPPQLSGGQQQRVAFARALVKQPPILIADEPTAHLDEETNACIQQVLDKVVTNNEMIAIVATHDDLFCQNAQVKRLYL